MTERQADYEDRRPKLGPEDAVIDEALAASLVPRRPFGAHKWGVGGVVIVAGAPHYVGAPLMAAQAAGRAGAGVTALAVPRGVIGIIAAAVPEAVYLPLPETESTAGARQAVETILAKLEQAKTLVVGPGLGQDEAADNLLGALFGRAAARRPIGFSVAATGSQPEEAPVVAAGKPLLVDADGLNWLAKQERWPDLLPKGRALLTPHVGEMARLSGRTADEIVADPLGCVREMARAWGQTVVLKTGYTAVSEGVRCLVAPDAPRSLAKAGTGDVFAGTIGAFLAQGLAPLDAAALAIYVGCRAARRVERLTGTLGLVATDLPPAVAEELALLERRGRGDA